MGLQIEPPQPEACVFGDDRSRGLRQTILLQNRSGNPEFRVQPESNAVNAAGDLVGREICKLLLGLG
jgi:hypothetical protein